MHRTIWVKSNYADPMQVCNELNKDILMYNIKILINYEEEINFFRIIPTDSEYFLDISFI